MDQKRPLTMTALNLMAQAHDARRAAEAREGLLGGFKGYLATRRRSQRLLEQGLLWPWLARELVADAQARLHAAEGRRWFQFYREVMGE